MIGDLCKHHLAELRGEPAGELLVASPGCPKCPDPMVHLLKRLELYARALEGTAVTHDKLPRPTDYDDGHHEGVAEAARAIAKYLQRLARKQRSAIGKSARTHKRPAPAKGTGRTRSA